MENKVLMAAVAMLLMVFFGGVVAAYNNELSVKVSENIDVQAESDGIYTWQYTTTGGDLVIEVYNENSSAGLGINDTRISDIWIPLNDTNNVINLSSCQVNVSATTDTNVAANTGSVQFTYINCTAISGYTGNMGTTLNCSKAPDFNENLNGTNNYSYIIHINEIQNDSKVVISCDLNTSATQTQYPIIFSENYYPRKIINNACTSVNVTLNITNNNEEAPCGDFNVTVKKILDTSINWSSVNVTSAIGNTSTDGNKNITWTFNLSAGATSTLNFTVSACPNMTANTSKIELGRAYVDYELLNDTCMNETYTGIKLGQISSVGPARIEVEKGQVMNSTPPQWNETAAFYNEAGDLNYTLYRIAIWATNGTNPPADPNDDHLDGSDYNCSNLSAGVANGSNFNQSRCGTKTFNFSGVPVIWADPDFEIVRGGVNGWEDYYQYENSKNSSNPLESDYFLIEKIWVINGYLIQAIKKVEPHGTAGCYNVSINVTNLGATCSPYVYLYDIIPPEFYNTSNGINNMSSPYNVVVFNDSDGNGVFTNTSCSEIAKPGNTQALTVYNVTNVSAAYLLAFADPTATENWTLVNCNGTFNESQYTGKQALSGTYSGEGYYWELFPLLGGGGTGTECPAGLYENAGNITAEQSVIISYSICGDDENATYYATDLFVVGVDPIHAMGATSPSIFSGIGIVAASSESIPVLLTGFLTVSVIVVGLWRFRKRE